MTDLSLSVQPQAQKKDNTLPFVIGGGVIGGAGGALAAHHGYGIKSKVDLDRVFAMEPDSFDKHIKNAGENSDAWKTAQEWTQKIKDAENEYDKEIAKIKEEAKKDVVNLPEDSEAKKNLDAAEKAYNDRLKQLIESEKTKLEAGNVKTSRFPSRAVLQKNLTYEEFRRINQYLNRYESARKGLLGQPGKKFAGASVKSAVDNVVTARSNIEKVYGDAYNKVYKKLKSNQKANFDPLKHSATSSSITQLVDARLPKGGYASYNYNQFKEMQEKFGSDIFGISESSVSGAVGKVKNSEGKTVWLTVDKEALKVARANMKDEYASRFQKAIEVAEKLEGFNKEFFEANKTTLMNDIRVPVNKAKSFSGMGMPKDFTKILDSLEVIELSLNKKVRTYPVDLGFTKIKNAHEMAKLKAQLECERDLATKYYKEISALKHELNSLVNSDITVISAQEKLQQKIANDSGLQKALKKFEALNGRHANEKDKALYQKVKDLMGGEVTLSAAEIDAQAETKAKELIASMDESTKLETARKEAQEAAKKSGLIKELTDKEAIEKFGKSKEDFVKGVKDDAKKAVEKNLERMKIANKTVTGIAAAATLALAGLGIAAISKKDA